MVIMNLGVIIVSYNVRALLHSCLTSLVADIARTPDLDDAGGGGGQQLRRWQRRDGGGGVSAGQTVRK